MHTLPILVVDDNEFIRSSMVKFLESNNYAVNGASNARDAMEFLKQNPYGLVITDVLMPETDGFELVDFIRDSDESFKNIPIIAISGGGRTVNANAILSALEEKVNCVMKKPFRKKELLDKVAELIK
jgi:CheY-like chemotaxis protein